MAVHTWMGWGKSPAETMRRIVALLSATSLHVSLAFRSKGSMAATGRSSVSPTSLSFPMCAPFPPAGLPRRPYARQLPAATRASDGRYRSFLRPMFFDQRSLTSRGLFRTIRPLRVFPVALTPSVPPTPSEGLLSNHPPARCGICCSSAATLPPFLHRLYAVFPASGSSAGGVASPTPS